MPACHFKQITLKWPLRQDLAQLHHLKLWVASTTLHRDLRRENIAQMLKQMGWWVSDGLCKGSWGIWTKHGDSRESKDPQVLPGTSLESTFIETAQLTAPTPLPEGWCPKGISFNTVILSKFGQNQKQFQWEAPNSDLDLRKKMESLCSLLSRLSKKADNIWPSRWLGRLRGLETLWWACSHCLTTKACAHAFSLP